VINFTLCTVQYATTVIKCLRTKWIYSTHGLEEKCVLSWLWSEKQNYTKMEVILIGQDVTDWIQLAQCGSQWQFLWRRFQNKADNPQKCLINF